MKQYKANCPSLRLVKEPSELMKIKVVSSKDAADYVRQFWGDDIEQYESMFLLLLNQANNTIGWVKLSQGGLTGTICDPIIVAKYAIESLAKGVILVHNHPSGNLKPSVADEQITSKIKAGLSLFDIKVLDHIILTVDGYFSFIDEGLL